MKELQDKYNTLLKEYRGRIVNSFSKKDYLEFNEILFSAHSCGIEGNSFSVNDTRELKEGGLSFKPYNKSLLEAFELLDHFNALKYLRENIDKPLSEALLIETQRILTNNTMEYIKGYSPGCYTKTRMGAGDTVFQDHKEAIRKVPILLKNTQEAIINKSSSIVEISAMFHKHFIYLHPFPDGNGRLGRLISNFILSKENHPFIIIEKESKNEYINALKASHKHNDLSPIVSFFYSTAINRMENELKSDKNNNVDLNNGNGMSM